MFSNESPGNRGVGLKTLFPITHQFIIRRIRSDDEPAILEIYRGAGSNNWLVNPSSGLPSALLGMNNIRTRTQGLHRDPAIDFDNVTGSITYAHTPLETWEGRTEREDIHWVFWRWFRIKFSHQFWLVFSAFWICLDIPICSPIRRFLDREHS